MYEKKHAGMKIDYENRKAAYEQSKHDAAAGVAAPAAAATPATAVATESDAESDETPSSVSI